MPCLNLIRVSDYYYCDIQISVISGCSPNTSCIPCRRLHVSCIGDKIVINGDMYPLVSGYKLLVQFTYPATCFWCKCGFKLSDSFFFGYSGVTADSLSCSSLLFIFWHVSRFVILHLLLLLLFIFTPWFSVAFLCL